MTVIRQAVIDAWRAFSEPLEGRVNLMYVDKRGLITTGVGNLIDPVERALELPWHVDGERASDALIRRDWQHLKDNAATYRHQPWYSYAGATSIKLADTFIDVMVGARLDENADYLSKRYFTDFSEWPADAQLGTLSMAWAVGADFPRIFPRWTRCAADWDWSGCLTECKIRETLPSGELNAGIVPRNAHNQLCFALAVAAARHGEPPAELFWAAVAKGVGGTLRGQWPRLVIEAEALMQPILPDMPTDPGVPLPLVPLEPDWDALQRDRETHNLELNDDVAVAKQLSEVDDDE